MFFPFLVYYSWAIVAIRAWTSISTLLSVFHSTLTQSLYGTLTMRQGDSIYANHKKLEEAFKNTLRATARV